MVVPLSGTTFFVNFYILAVRKSTLFPYICKYKP